jgi:hypothetical protein
MKLSDLYKYSVEIIGARELKSVVIVECCICGNHWDILLTPKRNIRKEGWKCPGCYSRSEPGQRTWKKL